MLIASRFELFRSQQQRLQEVQLFSQRRSTEQRIPHKYVTNRDLAVYSTREPNVAAGSTADECRES